jgi:SAM-dependent methyltransferase
MPKRKKSMRVELIRAHYAQRVIPGRDSFDLLDWGSADAQLARFAVYARTIQERQEEYRDAAGFRVLDIGCGLTDLCTYLEHESLRVNYVGVDIVPDILAEARRRHPNRNILLADIFQGEPFRPRTFHSAFCSGTLNLEVGNNRAFVRNALAAILPLVSDCLVVNFLHERACKKYPHCHYYSPEAVIAAVPESAAGVVLIDDYLENDFTLVINAKE